MKALVFDVFGTVVDWRGTVIEELEALGREKGLSFDALAFAEEWRLEGYVAAIARIRDDGEPWQEVDVLHRRKLNELIVKYELTGLSEAEVDHLNRVWHRLRPWPDAVEGLTRLKRRFVISPLSNGNFALLTNMGKAAGLPWDCIISADVVGAYKPDPRTYRGAARLLGLEVGDVMMVAAHGGDLKAGRAEGLATAFVSRPLEWGPAAKAESPPDPPPDYLASDFLDLAGQLGA